MDGKLGYDKRLHLTGVFSRNVFVITINRKHDDSIVMCAMHMTFYFTKMSSYAVSNACPSSVSLFMFLCSAWVDFLLNSIIKKLCRKHARKDRRKCCMPVHWYAMLIIPLMATE